MVWNWNYVHNSKKVEKIPDLGPEISSHSNFGGTLVVYSLSHRRFSAAITFDRTCIIQVLPMGLKIWGSCRSRNFFMRHFSPSRQCHGSRNGAVLPLLGNVIGSICPRNSGAVAGNYGNGVQLSIYVSYWIWWLNVRIILILKLIFPLLAPY